MTTPGSGPGEPSRLPPGSLHVRIAPGTLVREQGSLLVGGTPSRMITTRPEAHATIEGWCAGGPIGQDTAVRTLARRLLDAGILLPDPEPRSVSGLSVVVPTYRRLEQLARCLESIRTTAPEAEVTVVDDCSPEREAIQRIASLSGAALLRHPYRRGAGAARNTGMREARFERVAFIDSDVLVSPGCLQRLVAYFDDPMTAVVAPRVLAVEDGPGAIASYEAAHSTLDMGRNPGRVRALCPVPYLPSATFVVRRNAVGTGFDESLHIGEDVDLIWRITEDGWGVWYDPTVTVRHAHRLSARGFITRRFTYAESIGLLATRHKDNAPALHLSPSMGVLLLAAARRPWLAGALALTLIARMRTALTARSEQPTRLAAELMTRSFIASTRGGAYAICRPWLPLFLLASPRSSRARALIAAATVFRVFDTRQARPSQIAIAITEDAVASAGTWWSCLGYRTLKPLLPARPRRSANRPRA